MDIHHLRVFLSVYRHRSFSKASKGLYLSQPTVSEHIKTLEDELNCRLFDRLGRTIIPTEEAGLLYPLAEQIIEEVESIKGKILSAGRDLTGDILLGASTIPGTYILPYVISDFKKMNPGVSFRVIIEDSRRITEMVLNHDLVLGVVGAEMDNESLEFEPFIEDELILAVSGDLADGDPIGLEELSDLPFVIREEGSGTRKTVQRYLSARGIDLTRLNIVAELGSTDSVKEAIKAGLGASILSRVAIREELEREILKEVGIKGLKMERNFFFVTHRKRTLPRPYRAFLSYMKNRKPRL